MLNEHDIVHGLFQFERVLFARLHIAERLIQARHHARQAIIAAGIVGERAHQAAEAVRCDRAVQPVAAASAAALHRPNRVRAGAARVQLHFGLHGCGELRFFHLDAVVDLLGGQIVQQILGHAHQQQRRQYFDEETPHPRRHFVRGRLAVMDVQYENGDQNAQPDQHHGKEEIFAQQWQRQRCGRYNFGHQQKEHGLRQQNADAQRDFLARIGRQIEHQHRQIRDADARDDQVHRVEERFAAQRDVEENVCVTREFVQNTGENKGK